MARTPFLLLLLAALISLVSAGAPTFCKCTCFKNSTIIPLGPEHQNYEAAPEEPYVLERDDLTSLPKPRTASTHCSECTKSFCLSQGIDICENAKEDDVMTLCFQRDSNKDKIIVWGFIVGTVGLLGWAFFKNAMAWREGRAFARADMNYAPISAGGR